MHFLLKTPVFNYGHQSLFLCKSYRDFSWVTNIFVSKYLHKKLSKGVKSVDLGGHFIICTFLFIRRVQKTSCKMRRTDLTKCEGAASFVSINSRYIECTIETFC